MVKREMWLQYMSTIAHPPKSGEDMYAQACSSDGVTVNKWRDIWINQTKANKEYYGTFTDKSIAPLYGENHLKPAIVVGSGPSLAHNVDVLATIKDITIISCLHNFHYMVDHGVSVKYFVTLDAGAITIEEMFEGGSQSKEYYLEQTKNYTLVAYTATHPDLVKSWRGPVLFFSCPLPEIELHNQIQEIHEISTHLSTGGNVLGACVYLAKIMGSNPIIFTGADFAFSNTYEVPRFHPWKSKYDGNLGIAMRAIDIYGNACLTWPSYLNFKTFFDWMVMSVPGIYINSTEGGILGAYPEGVLERVKPMDLKEVIHMYSIYKTVIEQKENPTKPSRLILY